MSLCFVQHNEQHFEIATIPFKKIGTSHPAEEYGLQPWVPKTCRRQCLWLWWKQWIWSIIRQRWRCWDGLSHFLPNGTKRPRITVWLYSGSQSFTITLNPELDSHAWRFFPKSVKMASWRATQGVRNIKLDFLLASLARRRETTPELEVQSCSTTTCWSDARLLKTWVGPCGLTASPSIGASNVAAD